MAESPGAMRRMKPLLGTFVEVGVLGGDAQAAVEAAFEQIGWAQSLWSFHDRDSELSRLNHAPGTWVPVSRPTVRLLRLCRGLMALSGQRFDPTVGAMLVRGGDLPDQGWGERLESGRADDIECRPGEARLRRPVLLTLDGVAKGYAVDLAARAMRAHGCSGGWVNAGGDMLVFGDASVPVQRRRADGHMESLGVLNNAALATSCVHAPEAVDALGRFPSRIVRGSAGGLAHQGVWTVLARSAWRADALTKVAAQAGQSQAEMWVSRCGGRWWKDV